MISSIYASKFKLLIFILGILSIIWVSFLPTFLAKILFVPVLVLAVLTFLNIFLGDADVRSMSIVGVVCLALMTFFLFKQGFPAPIKVAPENTADQKMMAKYQPALGNLVVAPDAKDPKQSTLAGTLTIKNPDKKPVAMIVTASAKVNNHTVAIGAWRVDIPANGLSLKESLQMTGQYSTDQLKGVKGVITAFKSATPTAVSNSSSTASSSSQKK